MTRLNRPSKRQHQFRDLFQPLESRILLSTTGDIGSLMLLNNGFTNNGFSLGGSRGFAVASTSGFSVAGSNFSVAQTGNGFLFTNPLNNLSQGFLNVTPSASLIAPQLTINGSVNFFFKVRFTGNPIHNRSIASNTAILVTGPHNFVAFATFVRSTSANNGTLTDATYAIRAPGGTWNPPDVGTYTITLLPNRITDINGTFVPSTNLGTFRSTTTLVAAHRK